MTFEKKHLSYLIIIVALLFLPFVLSSFYLSLATEILIMAVFALSLNILMGYTGLVSLGHAAFFGAGAYTAGLVARDVSSNIFVTIGAALVVCLLLAAVIGFFSTRASGFYFLMITLAFSQVIYAVAYQWQALTGGSDGLIGISPPELFGIVDLNDDIVFYFFILAVFLFVFWVLKVFLSSPLGEILVGIRENATRMKAMGYNVTMYKNLSFIIAGSIGGVAGALYSFFNRFVSPGDVYWTMSGEVLIMVLIGGVGTLIGPVIGAAVLISLETFVSQYTDLWHMVIGIVFILVVIFAPQGIVGIAKSLKAHFFRTANNKKKLRGINDGKSRDQ